LEFLTENVEPMIDILTNKAERTAKQKCLRRAKGRLNSMLFPSTIAQ
jgi:hypothetical protein